MSGKRIVFRTLEKGDMPLASEWNELTRMVSELSPLLIENSNSIDAHSVECGVTPQRIGDGIADFRETAARAAELVTKIGQIIDDVASGSKFLEVRVLGFPIEFRLKKSDS